MSAAPTQSAITAPGELSIGLATPREAAACDAYAAAHPRGTLYHGGTWRGLIREVFGHETLALVARNGRGGVVGLLPLVRLRSWLFGDFMVSMPNVNYGGAIGDDETIEHALMQRAATEASSRGAAHVELRDTVARSSLRWPVRTDKVIMELPLAATGDTLFRSFGAKLRSQIRRPLKEGAAVTRGGAELLPEFYAVFARNMRDLGTPVYPRTFFEAIAAAFPEAVSIAVVRLGGRAAAAAFLLSQHGRMEIPWASSIRRYNRSGVNMLLYWDAMQYAIETGHTLFDFGRSTRDGGTFRFKRQWGAVPRQCHWHYWLAREGDVPGLTPDNPRFRLAVRAWRRLPLGLANTLGPHIVKYLP